MPPYPSDAAKKNIAGDVILLVEYSPEGNVEALQRIVGDPLLVKAGIQAVTNWKFRPIKVKGKKGRALTYVGFDFRKTDGLVISSFPFGKWEEKPPSAREAAEEITRHRVTSGVAAGNKLRGANPIYPESAKHDRIQGQVVLQGIIDKTGHISLLEVIKAPSTDLAIASIEAVKTWEYKPYSFDGEPVEVLSTIMVNYTLNR
jgi:TonB family protein